MSTENRIDSIPEDEIDLVDIIAVLFRKKWVIIIITLIITGIAFGYAFMLPKKYSIIAMTEIGQIPGKSGGYQLIESMDSVNNRLLSFGQVVAPKMINTQSNGTNKYIGFTLKKDFKIKTPKKGKIVSLSLETQNTSLGSEFLNEVIDTLVKAHDIIQVDEKNSINRKIRDQKNQLVGKEHKKQSLKDNLDELDRDYKNKAVTIENNIAILYNNIKNIESQKKFQEQTIKNLENQKEDLTNQIKEVEKRYNILLDLKIKAGTQVREEGALSLMLYSNEIQHIQAYLSQIRERLFFQIPEQISKISTALDKVGTDIFKIKAEINFAQQHNSQLKPELIAKKNNINREIKATDNDKQNINAYIEDLNQEINAMVKTRIIMKPQISNYPVSPNVKIIVALGSIFGFFISIFLAFVLEFWARNQREILSPGH